MNETDLEKSVKMVDKLEPNKPVFTRISGRGWVLMCRSLKSGRVIELSSKTPTFEEALNDLVPRAYYIVESGW